MRTYVRVGAIIFYNGKLITTKMKRGGTVYHVLPGGGVEDNETIFDAIKREVKEEVNLEITKIKLAYIRELNIKDKGRGIEFYFYVEEYYGEPKKGFDPEIKESSLEDVVFIDLKDIKSISFHPEQLVNIIDIDKEGGFNKVKHLGLYDYP
jgi:ADP-ribose pyrophosphatase YjhB (NUDIX family)